MEDVGSGDEFIGEVEDFVLSLLQLLGIAPGGDGGVARQIILVALKTFELQLREADLAAHTAVNDDAQGDTQLLLFERSLSELRLQLADYHRHLRQELAQAFHLQKQLQVSTSSALTSNIDVHMALSLVAEVHSQVRAEDGVLRSLSLRLKSMYTADDTASLSDQIKTVCKCMQRRRIVDNLEYLSKLKVLADHEDIATEHKRREGDTFCVGILDQREGSSMISAGNGRRKATVTEQLTEAGTALEAAAAFLRSTRSLSIADSSSTLLLVVGHQGSGKTFICSAIEDLVRDEAYGTQYDR
jgi:hypothetical protein